MGAAVRPFAAVLGADISGVDIREPLSTTDRDAIRVALRGQPMTDEQHTALGNLRFEP